MLKKDVEMEMRPIVTNDNVIGCVIYYEPTNANSSATCYIRSSLSRGKATHRKGKVIISIDNMQFLFTVGGYVRGICKLLNDRKANNFRMLYGFDEKGREIMVIGAGKAEEEKSEQEKVVETIMHAQKRVRDAMRIRSRQTGKGLKSPYFARL